MSEFEFNPEAPGDAPKSGIDVLTLFREDLNQADRITLFERAAEQLRQDIETVATTENIKRINDQYDLTFVFNGHGNGIHVGQDLSVIRKPFITFVEAAEATDLQQDPQFARSVQNAFDLKFNNSPPARPDYPLTPDNSFHYWRDRGLYAKGSIILPIDIRHYAARLLDALIGDKYSQNYLNQRFGTALFQNENYDSILKKARDRGLLNMHSNAVRELTSTKQIIDTLLALDDYKKLSEACGNEQLAEKTLALKRQAERADSKLAVYTIYGTGHHAIMHEFRKQGIPARRVFPGKVDMPGRFSFIGSANDQFFSSHHFRPDNERVERYAKSFVLESLFTMVLSDPEYALEQRSNNSNHVWKAWYNIYRVSRRPELHERLPKIIESYKKDRWSPVKLLGDYGIKSFWLDSPE